MDGEFSGTANQKLFLKLEIVPLFTRLELNNRKGQKEIILNFEEFLLNSEAINNYIKYKPNISILMLIHEN